MTQPRLFRVGRKLYAICQICGNIVRVDKPIIGSWHICVEDEEER